MQLSNSSRFPILIGISLLMGGCSPRVITQISKQYPQSVEKDAIRVYNPTDTVPNSAEVLGRVGIVDGGMTTNCGYDRILDLAKQQTAQSGGNALAITDHLKPSFWGSSCHQIAGDILFLKDTIVDSNLPNPILEARIVHEDQRRKMASPTHTFSLNMGYSGIISKYYVPSGTTGNPKSGFNWSLGYDWVSKRNWGVGILYSGYKSSYAVEGLHVNVYTHYIAPEFVFKQKLSEKWILNETFGLGYAAYREKSDHLVYGLNGLGCHLDIGTEYMLQEHIGLGLNIGYISSNFNQEYADENESTGIYRLHLNAGIRFYF